MEVLLNEQLESFFEKLASLNLFLVESEGHLILKGRKGKLSKEEIMLIKRDDSIVEFIKENKEKLIDYLIKNLSDRPSKEETSSKIASIYELSPLQHGMLFHGLYDEKSRAYIEQFNVDFPHGLDVELLKSSWIYLLKNHTILRSNFIHDQLNISVQCVHHEVSLPFDILDFSDLPIEEQNYKIDSFLASDYDLGFDFSVAPLMRITLIKTGVDSYKMVWTFHHIILDGWSIPILMDELLNCYEALSKGGKPVQKNEDHFEDYIKYINSRDKYEEESFWKTYMSGFSVPTVLPFGGNTFNRNKGEGTTSLDLIFDHTFTEEVKRIAKSKRLTINTIIQGTWSFLLSQYTGNQDTLFGVTVSGRPSDLKNAEERVGIFINTIPLRSKFDQEQTILDWLSEMQGEHTSCREYQYTALSKIQNWSGIQEDFFDSIIVFENYPMDEVLSQEWSLKIGEVDIKENTNYIMTLTADSEKNLTVNFGYNELLLKDSYVEMIKTHFEEVFRQLVSALQQADKNICVGSLTMLSREEKAILLGHQSTEHGVWFNEGSYDLKNTEPINVRFERMAAHYELSTAVIQGEENWTYQKLNNLSNQIARSLEDLGVKQGDFVGIYLDRNPFMISSILGILKLGAIYVPLDTQNPKERIEKMVRSSEIAALITNQQLLLPLKTIDTPGVLLADYCTETQQNILEERGLKVLDLAQIMDQNSANVINKNDLRSWAYMLYTSGSTGEPKGAITRHDGAMNHLLAEYKALELPNGFRFLQSAGIGSDISVWQILGPLLKGGAVVIIDKMDVLDYEKVLNLLEKEKVSIVEFVPSYIRGLVQYLKDLEHPLTLPNLQWIMMVGEAVPVKLVNEWRNLFPSVRILNGYGPCEASDDIAQFEVLGQIDEMSVSRVPIGQPLTNMNMFVLDQNQNLCPIGVAGELCVSGVGVGAGYWKMPDKTKASFIPNPFPGTLGDTLYKTGDLGRWLPDGNLEFLGRIDRQVKVKGHRIELGEIESLICKEDSIKEAHLMVHEDETKSKALVAFLVLDEGIGHKKADQDFISENDASLNSELPNESNAEVITSNQKKQIAAFNNTKTNYPIEDTALDLFSKQVQKTPDAIAAVFEGKELSFKALDEKSNQLAHHLLAQGIGPEDLVPICVDRSLEMIIGILGILKAGGAYVPIEPDCIKHRIDFILEDTNAKVILSHSSLTSLFKEKKALSLICLDTLNEDVKGLSVNAVQVKIIPDQLVNVLYTSGTTGTPKGVLSEHRGFINHLLWVRDDLNIGMQDVILQKTPFSFDISIWELMLPLITGCKLIFAKPDGHKDPAYLHRVVKEQQVTAIHFVPFMLSLFLEDASASNCQSLRHVVCSGEALTSNQVQQFKSKLTKVSIHNYYGPTEASVHVTAIDLTEKDTTNGVSIGAPMANTQIHIVNEALALQPIGTLGELLIGGVQVARGYLNRPELTAEKFINDPFREDGGKLYRTGDLARWLPDGNIEFIGRRDNQVKIRGCRIELGEVEIIIDQFPQIQQSIVMAEDNASGRKSLVAYLVLEKSVVDGLDKPGIEDFMNSRLPDYMIPSRLVELAEFPLTSNGKINRKLLAKLNDHSKQNILQALQQRCQKELPVHMHPAHYYFVDQLPRNLSDKIDEKALSSLVNKDHKGHTFSSDQYVAPRNLAEEVLVDIWKELLNVEKLGIHDNFFQLGGDSIMTIQVVSRAKRKGYQLKPRHIFEFQTIAALSQVVNAQTKQILAEQGLLRGESGLLPIQQLFFETSYAKNSYENQAFLLEIDKTVREEHLHIAFKTLVAHHDALRFCYKKESGKWVQYYGTNEGGLRIVDLTNSKGDLANEITQICQSHQESLKMDTGELFRSVLIKTPPSEITNRLLVVADHLIIDGVSWRILMDHLDVCLEALSKNQPIQLGSKSTSFREWVEALKNHATTSTIESQVTYWEAMLKGYQPLPVDKQAAASFEKDVKTYSIELEAPLTKALLQDANDAYHTEISDLLLGALAQTISTWANNKEVIIGLEGHGREDLFPQIDLSNTVGWFTNLYPTSFILEKGMSEGKLIKSAKQSLRAIPTKGMGYGILRYLHPSEEIRNRLSGGKLDIVFNYLGQLDSLFSSNSLFRNANESVGKSVDDNQPVSNKFEINGLISEGKLTFYWNYSAKEYEEKTIEGLARQYITNLRRLIAHCLEKEHPEFTVSDYGLPATVSYQELDNFLEEEEEDIPRREKISSLYQLSPVQNGMLFHHLYDQASKAYTEQFCVDFPKGVDLSAFELAWKYVIEKHTILRSGFFHHELSVPVQCVFKNVKLPFEVLDYSSFPGESLYQKIDDFLEKDQAKGFDFNRPPLMRISLIKMGPEAYKMIWTSHHILLDGWSSPILMGALLKAYGSIINGQIPTITKEDKFEDFIKYIHARDKSAEKDFWTKYIKDFDTPTLLPFANNTLDRNKGAGEPKELLLSIDEAYTRKIKNFVHRNHITANTLVQGVWSFLLSKYTGNSDIIYGVTVSGRPSDLTDTEERVGLYINTLPLRSKLLKNQYVKDWLISLQKDHMLTREYQYTALNQIQTWSGISGDLFDSLLIFENYPMDEVLAQDWHLEVDNVETKIQTNYLLSLIVGLEKTLTVNFSYNSDLLDEHFILLIKGHFERVLRQIVDTDQLTISALSLLQEEERKELLEVFNDTYVKYPEGQHLLNMFEEQVQRIPESTAVVFGEDCLTYQQLHEQSNKLAHYLRKKGVKEGSLVVICMDRSLEMIVGLLGILKSGGTYIPVDPEYPRERVNFIINDTGTSFILSTTHHADLVQKAEVTIILIDEQWPEIDAESSEGSPLNITSNSLAYIIYTSGSTGNPKGVKITHNNLNAFLGWCHDEFRNSPYDVVFGGTSICFDISVFELYFTLSAGKRLRLLKSGLEIGAYLEVDENILLNTVPSVMKALLSENIDLSRVSVINMAGEPIPLIVQKSLDVNRIEVRNLYGPSEDTTYSTVFRLEENKPLLIGKPIANTQVYIVDEQLDLVPQGVIGQLCLSGSGVADGYWNRPLLTAEKFVDNPFRPNNSSKLYKTGDLARWLSDGQIEFLGRKDYQVKIRGYRIELEEIETVLQRSPLVNQCIVLAKETPNDQKHLVAYIVPGDSYEKASFQEYMQAQLPEYMIPSILILLETFPLTPNGKIDRKLLPEPEASDLTSNNYIAPRNEIEAQVVDIWENLLSRKKIGVQDNFFELGGDSIITIQVVSRIKRIGYNLSPRDLFQHPTVASLANFIGLNSNATVVLAEQGMLTGAAGLSPIQQWFFENEFSALSHFNQAILLDIKKEAKEEYLQAIIKALVDHHDSLRFTYKKTGEFWSQHYGTRAGTLQIEDFSSILPADLSLSIREACEYYQQSLNIESGDLVKAVLFKTSESVPQNRLFIAIHHLAIDGISWRILLSQIEEALNALSQDKSIQLWQKGSSYRSWVKTLEAYTQSNRIQAEQAYWQSVHSASGHLPVDIKENEDLAVVLKNVAIHTESLDEALTKSLLQQVNQSYQTEINDILLAALVKTLATWSGEEKVVIGLEGHGREDIATSVDITNTVGWFTSLFPVGITVENDLSEAHLIKSVKEQLRSIPGKGIGYGLLRYLHPSAAVRNNFTNQKWEVIFNYLGQLDNVLDTGSWFNEASEDIGESVSENYPFNCKFLINSSISKGKLSISWNYAREQYLDQTIKQLAKDYLDNLAALITHCTQKVDSEFTPSDYGLPAQVGYKELDKFLDTKENGVARRAKISSIYRLSPMQEGMLFHAVYDKTSKVYLEQFKVDLWEALDLSALQASWVQILKNHSILRNAFFHDELSIPIQCTYHDLDLPFTILDYSIFSDEDQERKIEEFLKEDQEKGLNLSQAPLMRFTIIKLNTNFHKMIWTSHHILMDGWSIPVLMEELLRLYDAYLNKQPIIQQQEDNYEDYIKYINSRDFYKEEAFWKGYLDGFSNPSLLPFVDKLQDRSKGANIPKVLELEFDEAFAEKVKSYGQHHHLTVNTILQGVWSILLSTYTGKSDVVYGVTVSGRSVEVERSEQRVGLYINTLPLRSNTKKNLKVKDWLLSIQKEHTMAREYQYTSINQIQNWAGLSGDFFDSIMIFENYPVSDAMDQDRALKIGDVQVEEQNNFLLTISSDLGKDLNVRFSYNGALLSANSIKMIRGHFENVLYQIIQKNELSLPEVEVLTPKEKHQVLVDFNDTEGAYPNENTLIEIFENQVEKTPDQIALIFQNKTLSYQELNYKANILANYLISSYEIKEADLVGIMIERSEWCIISILAILKAGAAYVPIDTRYPIDRQVLIINDTGVKALITEFDDYLNLSATDIDSTINIIPIDILVEGVQALAEEMGSEVENVTSATDALSLAYVMYTSGSTGEPKGVLIRHQSILRLIFSKNLDFLNEESVIYQYAPLAFDASTFELWGALLKGGKVVVSEPELKTLELIATDIKDKKVNTLWLTAGLFHLAVDDYPNLFSGIKYMLSGGDNIRSASVNKLLNQHKGIVFINGYGPTESTTFATTNRIESVDEISLDKNIIGRPLTNTKVYILDHESTKLVPPGCFGELCLAGPGLSVGYKGRADLTDQKFILNPHTNGNFGRLYRTGDWARWLPDGTIEFAGRRDHQVKIRGYRIELEEIEKVLNQSTLVKECAIIVHEDSSQVKRLVAYIVPEKSYQKASLQKELTQQLPDYMVPALIVELEAMPLNFNGKIDKTALPEFETSALISSEYVAPRNEMETQLASIWTSLLNVDRVGIYDNFFELGGDSIITIQVMSRAKQFGYQLSPRDLFAHQTIASLTKIIEEKQANQVLAEQESLTGNAHLLPIQNWFFENEFTGMSHFNQEVLLEVDKEIKEEHLRDIIKALVAHHDALRFSYNKEGSTWVQRYETYEGNLELEDLALLETKNVATAISEICEQYQQSLDIEKGKLINAVLIKTPTSEACNRLFIVIHHLVVDGVSWRILLEQIERSLHQLSRGKAIDLGLKTSPYRAWGEALIKFAESDQIIAQHNYWQAVANDYSPLPIDHPGNQTLVSLEKDLHSYPISLDAPLTKSLLQEVNQSYNTNINDLLLCALAKTIATWSGQNKVVIGLEGHGREDLSGDLDSSSTVGWFTNLFPISLTPGDEHLSEGNLVKSIKEQLRGIPDKGIGYGLLRYLHPDDAIKDSLASANWDIVFNYLGQLDNVLNEKSILKEAQESTGNSTSPNCPTTTKLLINSSVSNGKLELVWTYSERQYQHSTIKKLAELYLENLTKIIRHCQAKKEKEYTPHDYGLAPFVNYKELDSFLGKEENGVLVKDLISSIYRLSPVQEGMLFHGLFDETSKAYVVQFIADFPEGVEVNEFKNAWQYLLKNHSALRSNFIYDQLNIPVQCVYKKVDLPFQVVDFSSLEGEELARQINLYLEEDHQKGFDFTTPPLMRVGLIKMDTKSYKMVWTHHHLLADGWSMPILIEEFLDTYSALVKGKTPAHKQEERYEDFIKYIDARDKHEEERFWRQYMSGMENPSLLPFISDTVDRNKGAGEEGIINLVLNQEYTSRIKACAQKHHLTVNTLIQGVWSFLLSKYTGNPDTIFGVTVSGRPTDLAGSEQRVGLYINMLPLRCKINPDESIIDWLVKLQHDHTASREYQYTGLTEIQRWNGVLGDFFDSIVVFENYPIEETLAKDALLQIDNSSMKDRNNYLLDITVELYEELSIKFIYSKDLLKTDYVEMIKTHFEQVIHQIFSALAENNGLTSIGEIDMISPTEKAILLGHQPAKNGEWFNQGERDLENTDPINLRFEQVVAQYRNNVAVIHGAESWTYEDLNNFSNQIANCLVSMKVQPGDLVGIYMDRGPILVSSILGILKTGAVYLPLDTQNPEERIEKMVRSSRLSAIISEEGLVSKLTSIEPNAILVTDTCSREWRKEMTKKGIQIMDLPQIQQQSTRNVTNMNGMRSWAYLLYTSGSTGEPKGAITRHNGAMNHLLAEYEALDLADGFRFLQSAGIGSDISVWQILAPLLKGGAVVIIDKIDLLDYKKVITILEKERVDIIELVPSYIWGLTEYLKDQELSSALPDLKWIMMVGEAVPVKLVNDWKRLLPAVRILNGYGPCEASDDIAQYEVTELLDEAIYPRVPIGRPLSNMNIFILSPTGNLCGIGVSGELCVSGVGVGAGYWGMPEKTGEKFVENPFPDTLGERLYKTGDLARWLPDGNLDFLGRIDRQIKMRGHRIELGEIESFIRQSPTVSKLHVIPHQRESSIDMLIAFVVPEHPSRLSSADSEKYTREIRQSLQASCQKGLPAYMQPTHYYFLEEIPLNLSDKVDEKALLLLFASSNQDLAEDRVDYVAPRNETEEKLEQIWQKLLGQQKLGVFDDFFERGGDSLLAMRVVSHIRKEFQVSIPIRLLFELTTINDLAKYLRVMTANEESKEGANFEIFDL